MEKDVPQNTLLAAISFTVQDVSSLKLLQLKSATQRQLNSITIAGIIRIKKLT